MDVIAVHLPESCPIAVHEDETAHPLGALPEIELRDDEPPGEPGSPEHTYLGMLRNDMMLMLDALGGQGTAHLEDMPVEDTYLP